VCGVLKLAALCKYQLEMAPVDGSYRFSFHREIPIVVFLAGKANTTVCHPKPLLSSCRSHLTPLLMAYYPVKDPKAPPASEWMYAMLKAGQSVTGGGKEEAKQVGRWKAGSAWQASL